MNILISSNVETEMFRFADERPSVFQEAIDMVMSFEKEFNDIVEKVNIDKVFRVNLEKIKFSSGSPMFQQDIDTLEAAIKVASEDDPEGMAVIQLKLSISLLRARFFRELSTLQIHLVHGAFSDVQTQKRVLSLFTRSKVSRSHGAYLSFMCY